MGNIQTKIIEKLGVKPRINAIDEIRKTIDFIISYMRKTDRKTLVLGISGGQDSTLVGKLCQMAVDELNGAGEKDYKFIAIRLPYGSQIDESDAKDAIDFISADEVVTIDIKPAVDAGVREYEKRTGKTLSDFTKGNRKARERMIAQFEVAGEENALVVGTDHAAEAITGFYTKFGDGAADIMPIYRLNKRQGKTLLKELRCPEHLYLKQPTADLEDDKPQLSDEVALGITYNNIDDYLEGKEVSTEVNEKIEKWYAKTNHKRELPVTIFDEWWKTNIG